MNLRRSLCGAFLFGVAAISVTASAATTISIDSVVQRWPWNNKVDITYTIGGDGQDVAVSRFRRIVFSAVIDGQTYTIDGVKDIGANAANGTHTVTWTAPSGVKRTDCTMSAAVYSSDAPSGDDYLVIDLTKTGADSIAYEGLLASQDASNARYNTAPYKTDKLVLRKVPAGGPYPTGEYSSARLSNLVTWTPSFVNSPTNWVTDRAYYIGVFPVTNYQYEKLYGSKPSSKAYGGTDANPVDHRPVENMTWDDLRLADTSPTSSVPTVAESGKGTFLQRLNFITGNKFGFDLPTEVMAEIAIRAGSTTIFPWGNGSDASWGTLENGRAVSADNSGDLTVAVGTYPANAWGLYDVVGNVYEWCLDDCDDSISYVQGTYYPQIDPVTVSDAFTPRHFPGSNTKYIRGGGHWGERHRNSGADFGSAFRKTLNKASTHAGMGFRVSMIVR